MRPCRYHVPQQVAKTSSIPFEKKSYRDDHPLFTPASGLSGRLLGLLLVPFVRAATVLVLMYSLDYGDNR